MGLNDRRMGGGRDGWWLMCRQRRSLLCVSEAYKAASVCDGTERQGTVAQPRCRCLPSHVRIILFQCFVSSSVPQPVLSLLVSAQLQALAVFRESRSPQCGDATSFSSHYVLIRGRHRGGGEDDQKQIRRCATELHTVVAQDVPEMKEVRVQ